MRRTVVKNGGIVVSLAGDYKRSVGRSSRYGEPDWMGMTVVPEGAGSGIPMMVGFGGQMNS
jgi:hypothetical protein